MSNLPIISSKLPAEFNGFSRAKEQIFSIRGNGALEIEAACPVAIIEGNQNEISVEIDADPQDVSNFHVRQQGDTVSVHQNRISASNISGGNISFTNGRVFVNGREVRPDQDNRRQSSKTPRVIIRTPVNGNLDAKMLGGSLLVSAVPHNEAYLDLSGQTQVGVAARNLNVDASGQSKVSAFVDGGELEVDLSGQGSVHVEGSFSKVKAELSGMGTIETSGLVSGDYKAEASGMGSIVHRGQVQGRVRKNANGMARIFIA